MKIAVIDDGVARGSLRLPVRCWTVRDGEVREAERDASPDSHGTICARIATRGVRDAEVISLSVYDENRPGKARDLEAALRWCLEDPPDYINLSNGIAAGLQAGGLNEACRQLWERGTVLYAGISNDWKYTLPAQLPWVTGVSCRRYLFRRRYNPFVKADIRTGGLRLCADGTGRRRWQAGNSIACAAALNREIRKEQRTGRRMERRISRYVTDLSLLGRVYLADGDLHDAGLMAFPETGADPEKEKDIVAAVTETGEPEAAIRRMAPYAGKIRLLAWCGRGVPAGVRKWCAEHGIPLRKGPAGRGRPVRKRDLSGFFDTFIIGITEGARAETDAAALRKRLADAGYSVMLFSDDPRSAAYGAASGRSFSLLCRAREAVNPDVMIVILPEKAGVRCDLLVTGGEKEIRLETEDGTESVPRSANGEEYARILARAEQRSRNGSKEKD